MIGYVSIYHLGNCFLFFLSVLGFISPLSLPTLGLVAFLKFHFISFVGLFVITLRVILVFALEFIVYNFKVSQCTFK